MGVGPLVELGVVMLMIWASWDIIGGGNDRSHLKVAVFMERFGTLLE